MKDANMFENFPELTIDPNGPSGITILAKLTKKYNLVEFTLNERPQPIFISPWMQFEPSEMNDERLQIASEIVRRATAHESLLKRITDLEKWLEQSRQANDRQQTTLNTTYDMWKADRKSAGFPEDFSDIKVWPPEMMNDYR